MKDPTAAASHVTTITAVHGNAATAVNTRFKRSRTLTAKGLPAGRSFRGQSVLGQRAELFLIAQ